MSLRNGTRNGGTYLPSAHAREKRISQCRRRCWNRDVCGDIKALLHTINSFFAMSLLRI